VSTPGTSRSRARRPDGTGPREFRRARPWRTGRSAWRSSSPTTTRSSTRSASQARRETSTARSTRAETSSKARASASIRCPRSGARISPRGWRGPRESSVGTRFPARRRSIPRRTRTGRGAGTTASARGGAGGGGKARLDGVPRPGGGQSPGVPDRAGVGLPGVLLAGRLHLNAKNSTEVSTIPRAQETGRLKAVTRAHVTSISVDTEGRATGVVYVQDGQEYVQPADVVLLAGYTYENVRLLLLSKSKPYPNGLSNNRGQVGKHYMTHNTLAGVTGLFPWHLNTWYGLPAQGVAVDNWADDNFDHASLDFIGGGNLWVYTERRPIFAASMATLGKAPAWGSAWKAFIKENAERWNRAYLQETTPPA